MTLRVPYEGFVAAVERHLTSRDVYVHGLAGRVVMTAGDPKYSMSVVSSCRKSLEDVRREIHAAGLHTHDGLWSVDDDEEILGLPYVAAISYRASKNQTGVWVDAYATEPSEAEVVQAFFDEMATEQGLPEMSLTDFVTNSQLKVSIVTPLDLERFMGKESA